jgi:hypothetical protein
MLETCLSPLLATLGTRIRCNQPQSSTPLGIARVVHFCQPECYLSMEQVCRRTLYVIAMSEGDRHAHKVNNPKVHCCDGRGKLLRKRGGMSLEFCWNARKTDCSRMTHQASVWGRVVGGPGICRDDPDYLVFLDLCVGDRILFLIFDAGKDSRK